MRHLVENALLTRQMLEWLDEVRMKEGGRTIDEVADIPQIQLIHSAPGPGYLGLAAVAPFFLQAWHYSDKTRAKRIRVKS